MVFKGKKKNLVNFFFFKSVDVTRFFFYKVKYNYKLYQVSLVFLRKVFKSLFFVRTLFLDKFLLQKILIFNFNFVFLNGLKYIFDLFFYDSSLFKLTFFILEFKNLNHIYKFKNLRNIDLIFFHKQKFRNFIKVLFFKTGILGTKLRKFEFFQKKNICVLKSFYKLLDIYWLRLFIEKLSYILKGSFILCIFNWGRWFKFRRFENYKYTSYLPWCMYSLVFIVLKSHLVKNVTNLAFF